MGNVWGAMKKHQAEQAEAAAAAQPSAQPIEAESAAALATVAESPLAPKTQPSEPSTARPATVTTGSPAYSPLAVAHHDRGGPIAEEFRSLRTNLLSQANDQKFCMMLTSSDIGEGKTVTCLNLGIVMAERQDRRTIIVDFDLRRRTMAGLLSAKNAPGIVDVLRGNARLDDVIQPTFYPNLFFIPAGEIKPEELGELVTRPELDECAVRLRQQFDYVLVDSPPVNIVSETAMIGRAFGDALLVVRMNKTHKESVDRAIRLLRSANIRLSGMVLTHRTYAIPNYLYKYS